MIKLIYPEANEQLLNQCEGLMTKVIFNEKADKNIKEASSNSISRELLSELKPDKDHFAIHFIGVGDYEKYGFNKNADAFPKLANEKYYDTFEKKAHLFREHKSDNPDVNAIGVIKKAAYNPEMGRIEIVAHCNIKKAAEEYEKAKSGGYLSCSMGCSVPNDRDSITGQLSKTPAEYSDYMRKRAGQYIPEHKKYAFVYNDEPTFFDLSIVKRPAERIAHALEYKFASDNTKDLLKTASDNNTCIPSALLAEMAGIKYSLNTDLTDTKKIATLKKLTAIEKDVSDIIFNKSRNDNKAIYVKNAAINSYSKHDELSKLEIANLLDTGVKGETVFRELAKRASVLPFKSFVDLIFPEETEAKYQAIKLAACSMLPSIFESLPTMGINLSALENLFNSGSALDCISDNGDSDPVQKFMDQAAERFSVEEEPRSKRIIKITIINNSSKPLDISDILPQIIKSASEGVFAYNNEVYNKAVKYSTAYALYKIAAINDIEKFRGKELDDSELYALIAQNYIYNI